MKTAVIIGVGAENGVGAALARRFAERDLHIFVAGRTKESLDKVVESIQNNGGSASAHVTDTTIESDVSNLIDAASAQGPIDLAIYNAGNNFPGNFTEMEADYFSAAWRVCCLGGFLFAKAAISHMLSNHGGTLLFTGASASLRGRAGFAAFNSAKSALRTMAQAIAKEVGPNGIHVGHVVIDGAINGEKIKKNFPEYVEQMGEEGLISIEAIVDAYEYLYNQPATGWTFELDLRTAVENW